MLVELYHLDYDITEVDNYFSQNICMCFREKKKIKGTFMAYFFLQSLENKILERDFLLWSCPETFPFFLNWAFSFPPKHYIL